MCESSSRLTSCHPTLVLSPLLNSIPRGIWASTSYLRHKVRRSQARRELPRVSRLHRLRRLGCLAFVTTARCTHWPVVVGDRAPRDLRQCLQVDTADASTRMTWFRAGSMMSVGACLPRVSDSTLGQVSSVSKQLGLFTRARMIVSGTTMPNPIGASGFGSSECALRGGSSSNDACSPDQDAERASQQVGRAGGYWFA